MIKVKTLGSRTQCVRKEGTDESTELWQHSKFRILKISFLFPGAFSVRVGQPADDAAQLDPGPFHNLHQPPHPAPDVLLPPGQQQQRRVQGPHHPEPVQHPAGGEHQHDDAGQVIGVVVVGHQLVVVNDVHDSGKVEWPPAVLRHGAKPSPGQLDD